MNKIILTSGDKIFYFDKKILSSISDFVKSFEEVENEITTIPINNFNFSFNEIKIIQDYVVYLSNSKEYDYSKKSDTVEYYINEFNNYETNVNIKIARDFIMKLNYPQTDKVYNLSKYMNIKFLTEELFKFNIKKIIEIHVNEIDELKSIKNIVKINFDNTNEEYKEYIRESKIENIDECDLEISENDEEEPDDSNEDAMEIEDDNNILPIDIKNRINQDNLLIESNKKILRIEYLNLIRIYNDKINFLNDKCESLSEEINNKIDNLSNKIEECITNSQNLFFVSNSHLCKKCFNIWYLSEISNYLDTTSSCELCNDEKPDVEEIDWNLKSVLIKMKFKFDDSFDYDEYTAPETDNVTNIEHIYEDLIRDYEYLEDECLDCYLNRDLMTCGELCDNFNCDIVSNCCNKDYCEEHFGNSLIECDEINCDSKVQFCEECVSSFDNNCRAVCRGCIRPYCNDHIYRRRCQDCGWKISDDY